MALTRYLNVPNAVTRLSSSTGPGVQVQAARLAARRQPVTAPAASGPALHCAA